MPDEVVKAMPTQSGVSLRKVLVLCCLGWFACSYASAQETPKPQDSPYEIEVTVNKVQVPVVVRDKQGHSIGDLTREDFHVFDNGKPHPISAFMVEERIQTESVPASNSEASALTPTPPRPATVYPRFIIFLFDDLHMSAEEMEHAKSAATKLLAGSLVDSDIAAVVSLSGRTNSGLTRDHEP